MQSKPLLQNKLLAHAETVRFIESDSTGQHQCAIQLLLNHQMCIGKGPTPETALLEAEERAIAYLRGAGAWVDEEAFDLVSFGEALEHLKAGRKIARKGWNGKDQWLAVSCPETRQVPAKGFWSPHNANYAESNGGFAEVAPCITLKNAQGQIVMGWIPSTGDLFANDWMLVF